MFTPIVRWTLVAATLAMGGLLLPRDPALSILPFVAAALLAYGHFRYGTVWLAFRALGAGDPERARRHLGRTRRPDLLNEQSRAYYEWVRGVLASVDGNPSAAAGHHRAALDGALRTDHDRCVAACLLADALLDLGKAGEATEVLRLARSLPHREEAEPVISRVEDRLEGAET